ncbi:MAG: CpaF family protein [Clostridiaceae bacterium]
MSFGNYELNNNVSKINHENPIKGINMESRKKELAELSGQAWMKIHELGFDFEQAGVSTPNERERVKYQITNVVNDMIAESMKQISFVEKQAILSDVIDEVFGYGPITKFLDDDSVTEVMVNGPNSIYVEQAGKLQKTDSKFRDDDQLRRVIDKILIPINRRVDEKSPMVDARLPDGSRVNIIVPPLAIRGSTLTIRKFAADPFVLEDLITFGTLNMDMAKFLRASVKGRINILISGGTGSGKTTFLNVLSSFIPETERIVTIEDAAELQLQQDHVITLETRPADAEGNGKIAIRDLVVNSLRMRPDRIVVGEVRSSEALDMLQAMNTGHDGSLTTVHANTPRDSLSRLETMVLMSGMELPSKAIREQIASAINLIVQVSRFPDGSRKVLKISEVVGMESETITLQDIFEFKQEGFDATGKIKGKHVSTGIVPNYLEKIRTHGENLSTSIFRSAPSSISDLSFRR